MKAASPSQQAVLGDQWSAIGQDAPSGQNLFVEAAHLLQPDLNGRRPNGLHLQPHPLVLLQLDVFERSEDAPLVNGLDLTHLLLSWRQSWPHPADISIRAPRRARFLQELAARWPSIDDYPEDDVDDCPWNVDFDRSEASAILGIAWSRVEEVVPFVLDLAHRHDLHVYNPQDDTVTPPRVT